MLSASSHRELQLLQQIANLLSDSPSRLDVTLKLSDLLAEFFAGHASVWVFDHQPAEFRFVSKQPAIACPISAKELKHQLLSLQLNQVGCARYRIEDKRLQLLLPFKDDQSLLIVVDGCATAVEEELLQTIAAQACLVLRATLVNEASWATSKPLELINAAAKVALDGDGLDSFAEKLVSFLANKFACVLVSLHVLDLERQALKIIACASTKPKLNLQPLITARVGALMPTQIGIVGRAFRLAEPQLVNDVSADPNYIALDFRVASEFAIPIIRRNQVLGVLNLESERSNAFDGDAQLMLRTLADHAAGPLYFATINERLNLQHQLIAEREFALQRTNEKLRRANEVLRRQSMADGLTGIANRRAFTQQLKQVWRRSQANNSSVGLIMSDLDHFKNYNDGLGHLAGDDALKTVAKTMQKLVHSKDAVLARYGGEEFALLLPDMAGDAAWQLAEQQRAAIAQLGLHCNGRSLTLSAGVASIKPKREVEPEQLIAAADGALYKAKASGRNCVVQEAIGYL